METIVKHKSLIYIITIILIIGNAFELPAKSLKVESFSPSPFDLTASTNQKLDNNDIPCALIKIPISDRLKDLSFEGNIIEQRNDGSEIFAYISAGTKQIIIKSKGFPPLRLVFSDFGVYRLISKQVYNLSLQIASAYDTPATSSAPELTSIHDLLDNSQGDPIDEIVANANKLYAEGKQEDALPLLIKAAELGHTEALLSLGLLYEKGIGTKNNWVLKPNTSKAFINVQNSAQQGYAPAQKVLYRYYLTGIGVDANKELAEVWKRIYDIGTGLVDENQVFTTVELAPEYPGGEKQLLKDLSDRVIYPVAAAEIGIQGRIFLKFVVKKDGTIGEIEILKSSCYHMVSKNVDGSIVWEKETIPGGNKDLEDAAIEAVRALNNFYPGKMNGLPVNVWYTIPITFKLQE